MEDSESHSPNHYSYAGKISNLTQQIKHYEYFFFREKINKQITIMMSST